MLRYCKAVTTNCCVKLVKVNCVHYANLVNQQKTRPPTPLSLPLTLPGSLCCLLYRLQPLARLSFSITSHAEQNYTTRILFTSSLLF